MAGVKLDNLVPAYACTIHKSQGSEYPLWSSPCSPSTTPMLQRNLVYTGITRGKQLVDAWWGRRKALAMAVKNHLGRRRYTKLASGSAESAARATRRSWLLLSLRSCNRSDAAVAEWMARLAVLTTKAGGIYQ